jgi:hypothetical protein
MSFPDLHEAIEAELYRQAALVETACEAALQTGDHGVLVIKSWGGVVKADPHPLVPYGEIYEMWVDEVIR